MSHQSPTIAIPKKQTGDVDCTFLLSRRAGCHPASIGLTPTFPFRLIGPAPLRQIIATNYGENPDNYADECASLQRSRQDAVRGAGSDLTGE
jgi:hypothetical protein